MRIKYVTIVPDEDSLGHVRHAQVQFGRHGVFDDSVNGTDRAERHIITCFAGMLAQRRYAPRSNWRVGGSDDRKQAMELFWHIAHEGEKVRNLQRKLLWRRAECLIAGRWKDVQTVADALLKHNTLDAAQFTAVIEKAHGLKPFEIQPRAAWRRA